MYAYSEAVQVRRGGGRDRFGDPRPTSTFTIEGCVKWPTTSVETADYSQGVATGYQLALPSGADLRSTDEVRLRSDASDSPWWSVRGEPLPWGPSPFTGWEPGIIVALERKTG